MQLKKRIIYFLICGIVFSANSFAQTDYSKQLITKKVLMFDDTSSLQFVNNDQLYSEHWDTLPQLSFWKQIINLTPDTCLINIAEGRKPLHKIPFDDWHCQNDSEKKQFKNFVCQVYDLPCETELYVTAGKKDFYEYKRVIPIINKSINVFIKNDVDPWYAQSILLIESPGKNKSKSYTGANGPFQLMRAVAVRYGLHVNRKIDERSDLSKSALAASKLLKTACIPKVKAMLDEKKVAYNETDLWFRLLVLHAYHAGAGNVACVINALNPTQGGIDLFLKIWKTECNGFKNESQNYSQIALANIATFDEFINRNGDSVFIVEGEKLYSEYKRHKPTDTSNKISSLDNCIKAYITDLVDGTVTPDFFIARMNVIQKEFSALQKKQFANTTTIAKKFPLDVNDFKVLGTQLLRKKKLDEAVEILKLNILHYPECISAYDSLSRAYSLLGKKQLAVQYSAKSQKLRRSEN